MGSKEVIKLSLVKSPIDVMGTLLDKAENFFMVKMPRASRRAWKIVHLNTQSSTRFIFILQGVTLFISDSTECQHGILIASCSCTEPKQCLSLFACNLSFTCCEVFTSKTGKNVAQSLEKSMHSKESVSKHSSTGFQASQQRIPNADMQAPPKHVYWLESCPSTHTPAACLESKQMREFASRATRPRGPKTMLQS